MKKRGGKRTRKKEIRKRKKTSKTKGKIIRQLNLRCDECIKIGQMSTVQLCLLQVIWVCILCRKKQELVVKTGKWILPTDGPMQHQQHQLGGSGASVSHLINDKRPRLERALSYERDNSGGGHGNRELVSALSASYGFDPKSNRLASSHHSPLQRSGSLQSHGTSSWRPATSASDLNLPTARGTQFHLSHLILVCECVCVCVSVCVSVCECVCVC